MRGRIATTLLLVVVSAVACKTGPSPTQPTPPAPPAPTPQVSITSVEISGGNRIDGRTRTLQLRATARLSDGTTQDQTSAAAWTSANTGVATVAAGGLVTSVGFGVAEIAAVYRDVRGALAVTVAPVTVEFEAVMEGFNIVNLQGSSFLRNGQVLASSQSGAIRRGFNVAAVAPASGELIEVRQYDTWGTRDTGAAMRDMTAYLNGVQNGTILLIGVHDEAGLTRDHLECLPDPGPGSECCQSNGFSWTEDGLRTLESLGARDVRRYCYRNSYALIVVKGQGVTAEHLINRAPARARFTLTLP